MFRALLSIKNGKSKGVGVMGSWVKFSLWWYKKLTFDTTKGMVQVLITYSVAGTTQPKSRRELEGDENGYEFYQSYIITDL